uniref:Uncharacterized protein n=1 Tax=Romanomermis culicivorax TaxID=13658 RepID=A0A915K772_ROMCU
IVLGSSSDPISATGPWSLGTPICKWDNRHSFVYVFYEDFHTYNDGRLKHAKLYKNYTEDYGYSK